MDTKQVGMQVPQKLKKTAWQKSAGADFAHGSNNLVEGIPDAPFDLFHHD